MGRYPGSVGLPGLRWFDRTHRIGRLFGFARSYVGIGMGFVDRDIDPESPTIFELAKPSFGALSVITRGLRRRDRLGQNPGFVARTATTHFRGDVRGWLAIDRAIGEAAAYRLRTDRPRYAFIALTGVDKTSHAKGHQDSIVTSALSIVDDTVGEIRQDAERDGRWRNMHLWIGSDHGHSAVTQHEDLAGLISEWGYRTLAHPWAFNPTSDVAVMVSGNAMAHLYLDLERRTRAWWPVLRDKWEELLRQLLARPSVDLAIVATSARSCEVYARARGSASISWQESRYVYQPINGDPLCLGGEKTFDDNSAYAATINTDYPDSLVQIAHLLASARSGDIVLSASRDWDYRARYEPIPHVSSHGALHRDHMLVPLLLNRRTNRQPRRTVDTMPSALAALGMMVPRNLDGNSFL